MAAVLQPALLVPATTMESSPLLRLPLEIRLMIYDCLLSCSNKATDTTNTTSFARILPSAPGYHDYEKPAASAAFTHSNPSNTLKIRTEDPLSYSQRNPTHLRTRFMIRSDRFRARCMNTTYHLLVNPSLDPTILAANSRIHAEAAEILYSNHTFDFDTHVEAIVPFFSDLTPYARSCVRSIRLVKRSLPYDKEFDRAEWATAISYIAENMAIRSLSLGIVAGKPGPQGWDIVPAYNLIDFEYLSLMEGMEWVEELLAVKGLEKLDVSAIVEHCPPPMSTPMARYIRFSASIDGTFAEFLKGQMLA